MYKMIIADDEQVIRESLAACIDWKARDIEVVACCKNGIEALDAIIDSYPDLMIADIKMPGLSGLELMEKIRERDQDIEVILISGYREFDYAKQALQYGVTDYLLKPINEAQLMEAVEKAKKKSGQITRTDAEQVSLEKSAEGSGMVALLKRYVIEHLAEPGLTLKRIAENVLYMNVDYVSRKFVADTGEKFSAFLTRTRMESAKELLSKKGKEGIPEVAAQVGCGKSVRYFSQLFKKHTGITPTKYLNKTDGTSR